MHLCYCLFSMMCDGIDVRWKNDFRKILNTLHYVSISFEQFIRTKYIFLKHATHFYLYAGYIYQLYINIQFLVKYIAMPKNIILKQ